MQVASSRGGKRRTWGWEPGTGSREPRGPVGTSQTLPKRSRARAHSTVTSQYLGSCGSGKLRADLPEIRTHAVEMSIQNAVQPDVCAFSIRGSCASELDVTLAHHLASKVDCVKSRLRGRFMGSPRSTHRFASLRQRRLRWANQCPRAAPAYASPDLRAACSTTLNAAARSAGAARRTHPPRRDQDQARQQQRCQR